MYSAQWYSTIEPQHKWCAQTFLKCWRQSRPFKDRVITCHNTPFLHTVAIHIAMMTSSVAFSSTKHKILKPRKPAELSPAFPTKQSYGPHCTRFVQRAFNHSFIKDERRRNQLGICDAGGQSPTIRPQHHHKHCIRSRSYGSFPSVNQLGLPHTGLGKD